LEGKKTIESRFYLSKYVPWDKVNKGDTIWFKNSGEPVIAKATVANVLQYENLTNEKIDEIMEFMVKALLVQTKFQPQIQNTLTIRNTLF
jgi:ASC-1-like (ASCH) protein